MSQFQDEAFQFDFVKDLTICCHGNKFIISFYMQIVTYSRKFYFVKINFKAFDTLNFPIVTATRILYSLTGLLKVKHED